MPGSGDVGNLGRMEGRETRRRADFASKIQMRRVAHALDRYHIGQAGIGVDVPTHHVKKINQAAVLEHVRNSDAFLSPESARKVLIAGVAYTQQKVLTALLADASQDIERKP
ncbi:hypothetical protein D3C84_1081230 [compost metagenome]